MGGAYIGRGGEGGEGEGTILNRRVGERERLLCKRYIGQYQTKLNFKEWILDYKCLMHCIAFVGNRSLSSSSDQCSVEHTCSDSLREVLKLPEQK